MVLSNRLRVNWRRFDNKDHLKNTPSSQRFIVAKRRGHDMAGTVIRPEVGWGLRELTVYFACSLPLLCSLSLPFSISGRMRAGLSSDCGTGAAYPSETSVPGNRHGTRPTSRTSTQTCHRRGRGNRATVEVSASAVPQRSRMADFVTLSNSRVTVIFHCYIPT